MAVTPPTPSDAFYASAYKVAEASVDRARAGAQFVQTAAAAIVTLYTGSLALAFSIKDNPLPLRAVMPAFFLAIAIAFAAYYLAFPSKSVGNSDVPSDANDPPEKWFTTYEDWMRKIVLRRAWALRSSVIALLLGAVFLPTPFVSVKSHPADPPAVKSWPKPPSDNVQLQKILYTAQVAEAAKLRQSAAPKPKGEYAIRERWLWWAFALGMIVVVVSGIRGGVDSIQYVAGKIPTTTFAKR
jgi:hypothetical protein